METKEIIEKDVQTLDGRWYLMRVLPYQIGHDVYAGAVLSFLDITELKKSKQELEEKNRALKDAQEIANIGNWELDIVNNRLRWSDKIYEIFEVEPSLFPRTYESFLKLVHPDDRQTLDAKYQRSLREKKPYSVVHRLITRDNRVKYVNEICQTEFDEDGRPVRSVGVVQDITMQKQLENDLRAVEERYRLLFNAIGNGVAVYKAVDGGEDFEFVDFNNAAERIEKVRRKDIVGKRIGDVFPGPKRSG